MIDSLHKLKPGRCCTAGRIATSNGQCLLVNADTAVALSGVDLPEGTLVKVSGEYDGERLRVEGLTVVHTPTARDETHTGIPLGAALRARAAMYRELRGYFERHDFLEVETPVRVMAAGTDPYLETVQCGESRLQTSPEFAMKRLLSHGCERIFQICKAFRGDEITPLHNPEFSILEFYRAWQPVEMVIDDVEALVRLCVPRLSEVVFERRTMADVVMSSCGFDLQACTSADALAREISARGFFTPRATDGWEEMFFELMVTCIDPYLSGQPPTFVTHWPAQLAVLARRDPNNADVALRFELYVEGIEICNGFEELTDPTEQRTRFQADMDYRSARGLGYEPMPEAFLRAMEWGLPESSGVAVGLDRLLMLRLETRAIRDVLPFWWGAQRF